MCWIFIGYLLLKALPLWKFHWLAWKMLKHIENAAPVDTTWKTLAPRGSNVPAHPNTKQPSSNTAHYENDNTAFPLAPDTSSAMCETTGIAPLTAPGFAPVLLMSIQWNALVKQTVRHLVNWGQGWASTTLWSAAMREKSKWIDLSSLHLALASVGSPPPPHPRIPVAFLKV